MSCLLDTSAYSAIWVGKDEAVLEIFRSAERLHISPVTLGELRSGFKKGTREADNLRLLENFLSSRRVNEITISSRTSERYAAIQDSLRRKGKPIPTNDIWIAASAMELGVPVVTRDRHFQWIDQILVWPQAEG